MSTKEIDNVTGVETTGHEWDGVKELNKPLPKWWLWTFYATIVWGVAYMVYYPSIPNVPSMSGYSQRATVAKEIADARKAQDVFRVKLDQTPLADIRKDADLLRFAQAGGGAAFATNCAPCHGRGAQGFVGYPNLADDDWVWGGKIDEVLSTIRFGIRSGHAKGRDSAMPKYGVDKLLEPAQIDDAAEYVLSLSGRATDTAGAERGKTLFAEQCAACHGENGKGNQELGAPNLADAIWLWGGERAQVVESIRTGRGGMMPQWEGRLDEITLKSLAVYVHGLGGGK